MTVEGPRVRRGPSLEEPYAYNLSYKVPGNVLGHLPLQVLLHLPLPGGTQGLVLNHLGEPLL